MRQFATHLKRPVWIKMGERQADSQKTEIVGLTPEQIFSRILRPDAPPLTESELEKHKTICE